MWFFAVRCGIEGAIRGIRKGMGGVERNYYMVNFVVSVKGQPGTDWAVSDQATPVRKETDFIP